MSDENQDFSVEPQVTEGGAPAEPVDAAALQQQLEVERAERERLAQEAEQARQYAQEVTQRALEMTQSHTAPDPEPPQIPDREEDPDGWVNWRLGQMVEEKFKETVAPLQQTAERDRAVLLETARTTAVQTARQQFGSDFERHEKEIMDYLNQFGPEASASVANINEAYYRVLGRVASAERREAATRQSAALSGGSRPSAAARVAEADAASNLTNEQKRFAQRAGMSEDEFSGLTGRSVTIDDYMALQPKEGK